MESEDWKVVKSRLPTPSGNFDIYVYETPDKLNHVALVKGDVGGMSGVLCRVHSECFTGDVLGSKRCDCGFQLNTSLDLIGEAKCGILIYLRQEGRGIGLLEKMKAYNLQDQGYDTVEANLMLGHKVDKREFRLAAKMIQSFDIMSVNLITNNPDKVDQLRKAGVVVDERTILTPQINQENKKYLQTKVSKLQHMIDF